MNTTPGGRLPAYDELPVRAGLPPRSSWGLWGDDDVLGCLNLLTPARALRAAASIRTGRSFPLGLDLTVPDPPLYGRRPLRHRISGEPGATHDDVLDDFNTQSSAQWDGFRHFPHREHGFYNGLAGDAHGIDHWAVRGIVGRAVLLDLDRWRASIGRPLRQGEPDPLRGHELDRCTADQGCEIETGDILLLRTGWLTWYRALPPDERVAYANHGASPGIAGPEMPAWLWDHHVSAVIADNPAVEMIPAQPGLGFLHPQALPLLGLPLGEMWDLDALAADCAAEGTFDSFFVSAPVHLPHGVASPPNAIAIR